MTLISHTKTVVHFPLIHRSRAFATGVAASTNYISAFASTKFYYNFEISMSLPGTVIFFGFMGLLGYIRVDRLNFRSHSQFSLVCLFMCSFIGMYLFLPETEGRSLEDIERYFADNRRKLTDTNIIIGSARDQTNGFADHLSRCAAK